MDHYHVIFAQSFNWMECSYRQIMLLFSAVLNSESIKPLKKHVKHWESLNKYGFIQFSQHRFKNYRRVLLSKHTNVLKQQIRCKNEKKARALVVKQLLVVVRV